MLLFLVLIFFNPIKYTDTYFYKSCSQFWNHDFAVKPYSNSGWFLDCQIQKKKSFWKFSALFRIFLQKLLNKLTKLSNMYK